MSEETKKAWEEAKEDWIANSQDSAYRYNGGVPYFLIDDGKLDAYHLQRLEEDRSIYDMEGHSPGDQGDPGIKGSLNHEVWISKRLGEDYESRLITSIDAKYALKKELERGENSTTTSTRTD